ncbi:SRPBCC family protein [Noviherbaspirillum sp. CPCC 100848]|uniref:SRPBCC family protein n=1 Tax=Noviherbaspirillum album TaxID=3080276 RepID=A0ABU6JGA5_9BURK|nr:SRPBCC family protein [Noviherbaspirillum sp. CPCC 100848]MEC4722320.1 SRPBCC family protein [Noviherbaspirillum sp. CPCC 100848]
MSCLLLLLASLLWAGMAWGQQAESQADDIEIAVRKEGATVIVDVGMPVKASLRSAWEVLTDYDHMAEFFPNLDSSKVVEQQGNRLRIEQTGKVAYGPLSFPFESVREIVLTPYSKVHSKAVAGTIKHGEAITRLVSEGSTTRIFYHSESVPNTWVPPGIGPNLIAGRTREQFASLREEILRRANRERPAMAETGETPGKANGNSSAASGTSAGASGDAGRGRAESSEGVK